MENVNALTSSNMTAFLLVLVALLGLFVLVSSAVEAWRKLRKPRDDLNTQMKTCATKFGNDQRRLDDHEKRIDSLEEGQRVMCEGVHALLEHELHNGNADEMQKAARGLFNYLNK